MVIIPKGATRIMILEKSKSYNFLSMYNGNVRSNPLNTYVLRKESVLKETVGTTDSALYNDVSERTQHMPLSSFTFHHVFKMSTPNSRVLVRSIFISKACSNKVMLVLRRIKIYKRHWSIRDWWLSLRASTAERNLLYVTPGSLLSHLSLVYILNFSYLSVATRNIWAWLFQVGLKLAPSLNSVLWLDDVCGFP